MVQSSAAKETWWLPIRATYKPIWKFNMINTVCKLQWSFRRCTISRRYISPSQPMKSAKSAYVTATCRSAFAINITRGEFSRISYDIWSGAPHYYVARPWLNLYAQMPEAFPLPITQETERKDAWLITRWQTTLQSFATCISHPNSTHSAPAVLETHAN